MLENKTENKEDLSKKITNLLAPENEEFLKSGNLTFNTFQKCCPHILRISFRF